MELRATRAELRQKLGNVFDHDDDASADMIDDVDEYEYVEEEIEVDVEVDNDDLDDEMEMDDIEGEMKDQSFAIEDGDDVDHEEDAEEDGHGYGNAEQNEKGQLDTGGRVGGEKDPSDDFSEEIHDQSKVQMEQTSEILLDYPLEVQEESNLQNAHENNEESQGTEDNIEEMPDLDEDVIEIGESEEIDGNEVMIDEVEIMQAKPKKDKGKKKKPKAKQKKRKRKLKKTRPVEVEEESSEIAGRIAQELAFKTTPKSESSLGTIVRALIPTILVLLLIVISHFGFELLLKQISPTESS